MEKSSAHLKEQFSISEMAVEGLFAGVLAGAVMLLYLVASGLLSGEAVGVMPGRFSIQTPPNPLQGVLLHLGVSGIYGMLFGVVQSLLGRRLPALGVALLYALAIYLLAVLVLLPSAGSKLLDITPLHFA
ncbi:MAG: hypothetical protein P8Z00_24040, partial [Anaerolineales bacterium]